MNKSELVKSVAEKAGLTKDQASKAIEAVVQSTIESLKSGDGLALKGFGSFSVQTRPARTGRNPKTMAPIEISEKKIGKFKFSAEIKKELN
jgi:DNA-binding protein HU-beta